MNNPVKKIRSTTDVVPTKGAAASPSVNMVHSSTRCEKGLTGKPQPKKLCTVALYDMEHPLVVEPISDSPPLDLVSIQTSLKTLLQAHSDRIPVIMSQIRHCHKYPEDHQWDSKDHMYALTLFLKSPMVYHTLSKVLNLPPVSALETIIRDSQVYPGLNIPVVEILRAKCSNWTQKCRPVILLLEELRLEEGLSYNHSQDAVDGYLKFSRKLADRALVFVLRSFSNRWQQPVGCHLSRGPMSASAMRDFLLQCIFKLNQTGLTVVTVVTNQCAVTQSMFSLLGVTTTHPYFTHGEGKVFVIYSPSHLMGNLCSSFKRDGFTTGCKQQALWEHIEELHKIDSAVPIRLLPHLTEEVMEAVAPATHSPDSRASHSLDTANHSLNMVLRHRDRAHVRPDTTPHSLDTAPQSLDSAAEILNHSVFRTLQIMVQYNRLPKEALHTAKFIENFSKLYNTFNSSTSKSSAEMTHEFTRSSGHEDFLTYICVWLRGVKANCVDQPPCLSGWRTNILSLYELVKVLYNRFELKVLPTHSLNCVGSLSAAVRDIVGRDKPNCSQLRSALQQMTVDSIMSTECYGGCQENVDEFLLLLGARTETEVSLTQESVKYITMVKGLPSDLQKTLAEFPSCSPSPSVEGTTVVHICECIIRTARKDICVNCRSLIAVDMKIEDADSEMSDVNPEGVLPSAILVDVVSKMERMFRQIIDEVIYRRNVREILVESLSSVESLSQISCSVCPLPRVIPHLVVHILLGHTLRDDNASACACYVSD